MRFNLFDSFINHAKYYNFLNINNHFYKFLIIYIKFGYMNSKFSQVCSHMGISIKSNYTFCERCGIIMKANDVM
jgi:hypothetical protein